MENLENNAVGVETPTAVYAGEITVKFRDHFGKERTVVKHNSGENGLFSAICRALSGYPIERYIPRTIMGYKETGANAFVQAIPYTATPVTYGKINDSWVTNVDNPAKLRYSFIIPSLMINTPNVPIVKFNLLNDFGTVCATVLLASTEYIVPESGTNIILYWDLSFANSSN